EAGLAHRLTQEWAVAGISLHGLTMAVLSNKFVGYAAFDTVGDANRAAQILADLGAHPPAPDRAAGRGQPLPPAPAVDAAPDHSAPAPGGAPINRAGQRGDASAVPSLALGAGVR